MVIDLRLRLILLCTAFSASACHWPLVIVLCMLFLLSIVIQAIRFLGPTLTPKRTILRSARIEVCPCRGYAIVHTPHQSLARLLLVVVSCNVMSHSLESGMSQWLNSVI